MPLKCRTDSEGPWRLPVAAGAVSSCCLGSPVTCAAPLPPAPQALPLPRHDTGLVASGLAGTQLLGGKGLWGVQARSGRQGHQQTGFCVPSFVLSPQRWGLGIRDY